MRAQVNGNLAVCIGSWIAHYRRDAGLTQEQLAGLAGIHPSYPNLLETGRRSPSLQVFLRLSVALRRDPAQWIAQIHRAYLANLRAQNTVNVSSAIKGATRNAAGGS